jgi:PASTA domain-containing protein/N-acetylmuramoyl-L-alanine amidase-like protein
VSGESEEPVVDVPAEAEGEPVASPTPIEDAGAPASDVDEPGPLEVPVEAAVEPEAPMSVDTATPPEPTAPPEPVAVRRRGLIPRWVPWAAGGTVAAIAIIVLIVMLFARGSSVRVPSLTGGDRAAALKRTQELGLVLVVQDTRFSASVPKDGVISQYPLPGTVVAEGSKVLVDVSVGSETFLMPDVTGKPLDAARRTLRERGLAVEFQTTPSDAEQGTVISSVPSAGGSVKTGDTVRLTVAAGVSATDTLLPSDLKGTAFVLDPALPPTGATADVSFDVSRRVRALLEASGARVVLTREVTDNASGVTSLTRLRKAKESTSTALIGLTVGASGVEGVRVLSVVSTTTTQAFFAASTTLSQALVTGLRPDFASVSTTTSVGDALLEGTGVPAARIRLGSNASSADRLAFSDPQWADEVARGIYRALAQTYGRR